jgi:RHS repeat-associated protein
MKPCRGGRNRFDGDGSVVYAYDAIGRQVGRGTGGVTTGYYYDGDKVIVEQTGSTYNLDTWGPNGQVRRNSEYAFYDGLGSAMGQTNSSGTTTEDIFFDAFGRTDNVNGGSADPFQYKSEYGYYEIGDGNITGQGLIKLGARYYDPLFGRFISRDSDLSQSPYSYCDGDPVNYEDETGHRHNKSPFPYIDPDFATWGQTQETVGGLVMCVGLIGGAVSKNAILVGIGVFGALVFIRGVITNTMPPSGTRS